MSNINYSRRITDLKSRYNPDRTQLFENRVVGETLGVDSDTKKYVRMAMMSVDDDYTQKSKQAGEAAKKHLQNELTDVDYRFQGSVMTDTHIKGASDIDLLVLCNQFNHTEISRVQKELKNTTDHSYTELSNLRSYSNRFSRYTGNWYEDMRQLRLSIERIMQSKYNVCDITKPKSVKITNQNLHRDVDVVTSCWYDTYYYVVNGENENDRAISIYNKDANTDKGLDYPFLSIVRINNRNANTNGRLKRMIRFLKNVRTDSNQTIKLSSFEINAICYNILTSDYNHLEYIQLVYLLWQEMYHLLNNGTAGQLKSVVGNEFVFKDAGKIQALKILKDEVWSIYQDLII